jgi:hypothetical protein
LTGRVKAAARQSCLLTALIAALGVFAWQAAYVELAHDGNWTALFLTGSSFGVPPALVHEGVYEVPGGAGYDGQFYHVIAHDPRLGPESRERLDSPRLRWRRILAPLLANALALGQDRWIDPAYFAVILAAVFLGTYWLAGFARLHGLPAWYGLLFVAVPAVLVSIERMTVDVVLAALAVGFWHYTERGPRWAVYPILVLAPLARETGIALPLSAVAFSLYRRETKRAIAEAGTALPFLGWVGYVHSATHSDIAEQWGSFLPFWGILSRTYRLFFGPTPRGEVFQGIVLDGLAVLGIWVGLILVYRAIRRPPFTLFKSAIAVFALFAVFLGSRSVWYEGIAFARMLSPLIVWLLMYGMTVRSWQMAVPLVLTFPREADELLRRSVEALRAFGG